MNDQDRKDQGSRGEEIPPRNGNGHLRLRAWKSVLDVIVQAVAVAVVVGGLFWAFVVPKIDDRIDAQIKTEAVLRQQYDSMIERWRIDHERWSAEKSTQLDAQIVLERELRLQQDREIQRLRDRLDNGRQGRGSGIGGAP